ncbi:MAG: uracil phosphoribosyltransferase [Eggerthellales bacterium]|nr:uracil phosphoribosyltransferase [Eggerthellales bacterium]
MGQVFVLDHPLIADKLTRMRRKETCSKDFRILLKEISLLMGYEVTRSMKTKMVEVETPLMVTSKPMLEEDLITIVPILRAGVGLVDGLLELLPIARVGHIGMYRDEETKQPVEYYCKMPADVAESLVIVVDPMLATGGSAIDAVNALKSRGCANIRMMNLVAAPEGIRAFQEAHPDVDIYVAAVDDGLDQNAYILPGLGDAGDRIFGTK